MTTNLRKFRKQSRLSFAFMLLATGAQEAKPREFSFRTVILRMDSLQDLELA